ncbi:hypothetical protein [Synoicihabitans lomoniglobus]|uniref:Tetratricopeptide repeat protein n=1 Tax=Synoicihabitans lomoniglobus TaxID=2909285 RepID=A0AAF0CIK4_9BACT|nr:hypothetical protein [Opitutaceae bacterium LMO-M01]WED65507.1 hypothetical protein PXH66_01420 [Opitutaceae bacterium LMO-M01]
MPSSATDSAREWLERGHLLAASGQHGDLVAALDCYDRARNFCDAATGDPDNLRQLGLAWMNRGNILQQLGESQDCESALDAYDTALAAFRTIRHQPGVLNTIGAALLNRGGAHQRHGLIRAAIADYALARTELAPLVPDGDFSATRNAAGATINLIQLQLEQAAVPPDALDQLAAMHDALSARAARDSIAATLSLEISRLELLLRERDLDSNSLADFTDTLEAALALAVNWCHRPHPTASRLAAQLFEFGARTYAAYQPQFLLEYLRDALDPVTGPAPFARQPMYQQIAAAVLRQLRDELDRPRVFQADETASHNIAALRHELGQPMPWLHASPLSS